MLLHGIFPPITTPFYADSKIYFRKLEQNVEQYSRGPIAGIVVQGSTGEAILLSDEERRDVLKCARDAAYNEKVLIAGTGIESAIETLRLTEYAADLGYDVAMVRTPHYYKGQMANPANMLAFYRFVCDRSPLPVIIYNFPQATGYDIRSGRTPACSLGSPFVPCNNAECAPWRRRSRDRPRIPSGARFRWPTRFQCRRSTPFRWRPHRARTSAPRDARHR